MLFRRATLQTFYKIGFITRSKNIIYDYRLRVDQCRARSTIGCVILDIDERSLDPRALGRGPGAATR